MTVVVAGSTGRAGRLVADELVRRGVPQRLLVRDAARAPVLPGAEVAVGDYGDPASLAAALREGDRVFMVSVHEGPERRVPLHGSFVKAAARARVAHVVYLSFVGAGPDATFLHARSHGATEAMLRESGLAWTAVRNGMYADEIPAWFDERGVNAVPGGDGRMSFTSRPELAEAIAELLLAPEPGVVTITTPDSVTMAGLAALAADVSGKPYRAEPRADADWEAGWRARGREEWRIEAGLSSYRALRAGELDVVAGDFRRLTGRDPLPLRAIVERLADRLPL